MAYVDTATGLEGAVVFLLGVENLFSADAPDGQQHEGDPGEREANARKLYMAITRTGSRLILVSWRRLPPSIERLVSWRRLPPSIERLFELTDRSAAGAWPP
jgi:superfamily I DNA/RNA helicase